MIVLTGCSDNEGDATTAEARLERFCDAWVELASGEARPVDEADKLIRDLERNAPAEITPTVERVTPHLREVSATFRRLGPNPGDADLGRAMEGLSPEAQAVVDELGAVAEPRSRATGPTVGAPVTDLANYARRECR